MEMYINICKYRYRRVYCTVHTLRCSFTLHKQMLNRLTSWYIHWLVLHCYVFCLLHGYVLIPVLVMSSVYYTVMSWFWLWLCHLFITRLCLDSGYVAIKEISIMFYVVALLLKLNILMHIHTDRLVFLWYFINDLKSLWSLQVYTAMACGPWCTLKLMPKRKALGGLEQEQG